MIKYPTGQKIKENKTSSDSVVYAGRGMKFEEEINRTNDYYRDIDKALIYKKPTPIKVVEANRISSGAYRIDEAYFLQPSTTDYNGIYRGKYLDFEAKETRNVNLFPMKNIHDNQINHLLKVNEHGGIAFLLVHFKMRNEIFLLDAKIIRRVVKENLHSITYEMFRSEGRLVSSTYLATVDYLKAVDDYYFG